MTDSDKILLMENRLHRLKSNGKNTDSPGVVRKIKRKIIKLRQS